VLPFMAAVSLWTPLEFPRIRERWFSQPNIFFLWPMPLLTALVAFAGWRSLHRNGETVPFVATIALFLLGFLGLAISSFPYLVPPSLTIWQAAAAPASQTFMLAGTVVLLPLILAYTGYVYWLFRGKIGPGETYH
jgi:cytochrome d ubiquinol oxidase subunit II